MQNFWLGWQFVTMPVRQHNPSSFTESSGKGCHLPLCRLSKASIHANASTAVLSRVKVLKPSDTKTGNFRDVLPCQSLLTSVLLFWHATLGVHSTICRHQPPQRAVLSHVDCIVQCETVDSQISGWCSGT